MEFRILGPLEVRTNGRVVDLGGPKPRGLFALLLLHAGQSLSADRIALALLADTHVAGQRRAHTYLDVCAGTRGLA
jgi:DNA-binding SARP family transcriptional activator